MMREQGKVRPQIEEEIRKSFDDKEAKTRKHVTQPGPQ